MTLRVPYMPDDAIERDAEALLAQYAHARCVDIKAPIPIEDIVENHLKLRVDFDDLQFGIIEKAAADDFVLDAFARPLAERFQVSPIAMRIRLENLGLLLREVPH